MGKDSSELLDLSTWKKLSAGNDWKATLLETVGDEVTSAVRLNTHRGRPLGKDSFLSKIESLVGRRLRPLPVGRPRKKSMEEGDKQVGVGNREFQPRNSQ